MGSNAKSWKLYLSPRFLASRVRKKGIIWCAHRFLKLIWQSTRPIRANLWGVLDNIWHRYIGKKQSDVLYAFYDLAVSPATFDIVWFLVLAELQRKQVGCPSLHIVIVPGPDAGFRAGDLEIYRRDDGIGYYDTDYMKWRLRNILVSCCWLISSCQQVTVCTSRKEAQAFQASLTRYIFPKWYTVRFPKEKYNMSHVVAAASKGVVLPTVQATPQARRFVSDWIQLKAGVRKVITITLRESPYMQDRNSNLEAWGAFVRSLNPSIYCPVVIRDTETAIKLLPSDLDGLLVFPEVVWNVELRAALYELSYLNMSVSNGPFMLCVLNPRARYLMFKILIPSYGATSERYFLIQGVEPGSQLPWASPFQRYVWEDDRLEVIQEAFREMCERIGRFSAEE